MKERYKKLTIFILVVIAIFVNFILADVFLFPEETIPDNIISRHELSRENKHFKNKFGSVKQTLRYKFNTEKGFEFTTKNKPIDEAIVYLKRTAILKSITGISTDKRDYSQILVSGLHGLNLYFSLVLSLSTIISIILLRIEKNMTDITFQNIFNFNFILVIFLAMIQFYNK